MLPDDRSSKGRLIWIIFDEMDQQLAFEARPSRISMPQFDRLRGESFYASEADSPAPETLRSLPSLLCGRKVADIKRSTSDLQLRFSGTHDWHSWSRYPNLFRRARALGFNTGLSGWHHSYCRVLGGDLSDCAWDGSGGYTGLEAEELISGRGVLGQALYLANWQARSLPGLVRLHLVTREPEDAAVRREPHTAQYQFILANALRMLANPEIELLCIHLPVPHAPGIWDVAKQSFTLDNRSNYFDNLALADRALGQIRQCLEKMGAWDDSAILVSADHPLRTKFWRPTVEWDDELQHNALTGTNVHIPFLLKLPNQKGAYVYTREFNTVVTQELLWEILNHRIETPQSTAAWLDTRASESLIQPEKLPPVGRVGINP
jgi:hypothetical protein